MKKVSFYSEGCKMTGFLRIPDAGDRKIPGIVCCHGFAGYWDVDTIMQDIAERLSKARYATLVFYHRGLGESEGPKGRVIPLEQAEDIRNAITYMQTRPEIDPNRIGLYGTSFGGGNVVYTAGIDSRAKCVVSTGGIGDCERWLKSQWRRWEWIEFLKKVEEDRKNRVVTGNSLYVDPHEDIHPPPPGVEGNKEIGIAYRKKWGLKGYTLESVDAIIEYKPEQVAVRISPRAVLFIHISNDVVVPLEESSTMYENAREPKKIVIIEGDLHHYDVYKYKNPVIFEEVMTTAIDWYKEYLPIE